MVRVYRKDLVGFYEVSEERARELEAVGYTRNKAEADAGRNDPGGTLYMGYKDTPTQTNTPTTTNTTPTTTTTTQKKNTTESSNVGLTQIRLKTGSYADVDSALVDAYIRGDYGDVYKDAVRTSDLPEFQDTGKTVTRYNEDKTVTYADNTTEEAYKAVNYYQPSGSTTASTTTTDSGDTSVSLDYDYGTCVALARGMYGFMPESIIEEFAKAWSKSGDANIAIAMTRQTKEWRDEFKYLEREDGSLIMSELNAVATIATYKQTLGEVGITNFNDFENQFKELIAGEVSGEEFQTRIDAVYAGVKDQIPQVESIFREQYGLTMNEGTIFAALINPDVQDKVLMGDISTAQIAGEARAAGFTDTFGSFEALRKAGLTQTQARSLYQGAGNILASADRLGMSLDLDTLESAAVGDAQSQRRLSRLGGAMESASSAVIGAQRNRGRITGLIEE